MNTYHQLVVLNKHGSHHVPGAHLHAFSRCKRVNPLNITCLLLASIRLAIVFCGVLVRNSAAAKQCAST